MEKEKYIIVMNGYVLEKRIGVFYTHTEPNGSQKLNSKREKRLEL